MCDRAPGALRSPQRHRLCADQGVWWHRRVYKTFDPRAKIMQSICHQLFEQLDMK